MLDIYRRLQKQNISCNTSGKRAGASSLDIQARVVAHMHQPQALQLHVQVDVTELHYVDPAARRHIQQPAARTNLMFTKAVQSIKLLMSEMISS